MVQQIPTLLKLFVPFCKFLHNVFTLADQGELQHRRVKGLFSRTNKKNPISQVAQMERIQASLTDIERNLHSLEYSETKQESLDSDLHPLPSSASPTTSNIHVHYEIADSQKTFLHYPTWVYRHQNDPAFHVCPPHMPYSVW